MGAIAQAFADYAQPLLDQTDGSEGQLNKAFAISQLCYNLALLPDDGRDRAMSEMRASLKMDDEEFENFRRTIVLPMIQRHREMFPQMQGGHSTNFSQAGPSLAGSDVGANRRESARSEAFPGTGRYAPCPCNSGRKYKFCCGGKAR